MLLLLNLLFLSAFLMSNSLLMLFKVIFVMVWMSILWKFMANSSHILILLLSLEILMLTTVNFFSLSQLVMMSNSETLMTFFTLAVCEASLGLGLLISLSRQSGSDLLTIM